MAHYKVEGMYIIPGDKCNCEWCQGHSTARRINDVIVADSATEATRIAVMTIPVDAVWKEKPFAQTATLKDIELFELYQWNAGSPTSSPFALATARGEL